MGPFTSYAADLSSQQDNAPLVINARHREHLASALQFLNAFLEQGLSGE